MPIPGAIVLKKLYDMTVDHLLQPPPVADGTIPPWLENPQENQSGNPPIIYNDNDIIIINNDYAPRPIYIPRVIYVPNGKRYSPDVDLPPLEKPPDVPESRLPEEADGQTPTRTSAGTSISVAQQAQRQKFGKLLHVPITKFPLKIRRSEDIDYQEELEEAVDIAANSLSRWMAEQKYGVNADEGDIPRWDLAILAMPEKLQAFSGEVGYLYGTKAIHILAKDFHSRRINAFYPVRSTIPEKYEFAVFNPQKDISFKTPEDGKFEQISLSKLDSIFQTLGGHVWYTADEDENITRGFKIRTEKDIRAIIQSLFRTEADQGDSIKPSFNPFDARELANKLDEFFNGVEETEQEVIVKDLGGYIKSLVAIMYYRSGFQDYPVTVPKSLTGDYHDPNDQGNLADDRNQELRIPHLTRFQTWQSLIIDELLGAYPIKINIKDSDLIKVGNQEREVVLPNVAESLAELVGMSLYQQGLTDVVVNAVLRLLMETGSTKKQSITNFYELQAITEYLGFKIKEVSKEVDFTFNPEAGIDDGSAESIEKAFEPKKVKIKVIENDDDDTLESRLDILTEAARIIKAVHFRKLNTDSVGDWVKLIKDADKAIREQDGIPDENGEDKEDFDIFLEKAEKGFTNEPGIEETDKPYGRPFEQRPRIKKIGNQGEP